MGAVKKFEKRIDMKEQEMYELAEQLGYTVWIAFPNFVPMYEIWLETTVLGRDKRITQLATLETADQVIDWLLNT